MRLVQWIKHHPVLSFFLFAFGFSWLNLVGGELLENDFMAFISSYGPALAGIVLLAICQGKDGLADLLRSLVRWKVHPGWYGVVVLITVGGSLLAVFLYNVSGTLEAPLPDLLAMAPVMLTSLVALTLWGFVVLLGEEIGWRGFALPQLQARLSPLAASLVLGFLWGVWHWPFWVWQAGAPLSHAAILTAETTLISVAYTWVYNGTHRSLFMVTLLHALYDASLYTFTWAVDFPPDLSWVLAIHVLVALLALAAAGPRRFALHPQLIDAAAG